MLHPSIESANPPGVLVNVSTARPHQTSDNPKEPAAPVSSQVREEERSSPVCAALWAY